MLLQALASVGVAMPFGPLAATGTYVRSTTSQISKDEIAAIRAKVLANLPFRRVSVPGAEAMAHWAALRRQGEGWPVIIGNDENLFNIADQFSMEDPAIYGPAVGVAARLVDDILTAAAKIDFPAMLKDWPEGYQMEGPRAPVGDWPSSVTAVSDGPTVTRDILTGRIHDRAHILMMPTNRPWEIPAYLRWGGWNACPPPEYHVAALKYWHDAYGAELVAINGDTIDVRAARRPSGRQSAITLAHQQYGYCPDIVDQGTGTLASLAAGLLASDWWFFWWD